MKKVSIYGLLFIGLFLFSLNLNAQPELPISSIDSIFSDVDKIGSPGCVLTIVKKGSIIYSRGYGFADLDHGIPINSETVMSLGSITKQFVAAGILRASQKGSISLNDDIRNWIPEFTDYGHTITVRHLIHHTSGIRDHAQLLAVGNLNDNMSKKEIVNLLARQQALNFIPGEKWLYSNSGYILLEVILERATGKNIQEYLSQEFFNPLKLNSAFIGYHKGIIPQASTSYELSGDKIHRKKHVGDVAGVKINSKDMAQWMIALEADKLGPSGFKEMQLGRAVLNRGDTIHYAFGLDRLEHRGLPIISHGGAGGGYRAGMAIYPSEDLAICAMCNLSSLDAVARIRKVAEILLEDRMKPVEPLTKAISFIMPWPAPKGNPLQLNDKQLAKLEGNYYSPELKRTFKVVVDDNGLKVGPDDWMRPMNTTSKIDCFTDGRGWAQINFERNEEGMVKGFIMDIGRVKGLILERLSEKESFFINNK